MEQRCIGELSNRQFVPRYSELPLGFNLPMLKHNPGVSSDLASSMCLSNRVQESLIGFVGAGHCIAVAIVPCEGCILDFGELHISAGFMSVWIEVV